ncbi:MAG: cache domain-containing protein [Clostridium sp.]|uniref:cache domain-containing protein n=1 Tax=Clostridium sp. TaxID=1506 RepID=UPI002FC681A3
MGKRRLNQHTKHAIITTIVSMSIALSAYFTMYFMNFNQYEKDISNKLYLIGNEQKQAIERHLSDLRRELRFVTGLEEVKTLQRERIMSIFSYLTTTKKIYDNVVIADLKGTVYYGYTENIRSIYSSAYYEKAVYTKTESFNLRYLEGSYIIEGCIPIINNNVVVGIIYMKMSLEEVVDILQGSRQEKGLESYLVNKDGYLMTPSKNIVDAVGKSKINLKALRLNIDHNSTTVYKDYSGAEVYGRYFSIEGSNWTLVIESDYEESILKQEQGKLIAQLGVALQGLIILVLQLFLKRKFGVELSDEELDRVSKGLGIGGGLDDKNNN